MKDSDPIALFSHVVTALNDKKLGFVEINEQFTFDASNADHAKKFYADLDKKNLRAYLKPLLSSTYVANGGYDLDKANNALINEETDLVSFGIHYLTNADLVDKFASGRTLNSVAFVKDMSKLWTTYFYG